MRWHEWVRHFRDTPTPPAPLVLRLDRIHRQRMLACKVLRVGSGRVFHVRFPYSKPVPSAWIMQAKFALRISGAGIADCVAVCVEVGDSHYLLKLTSRGLRARWTLWWSLRVRRWDNGSNIAAVIVDTGYGEPFEITNVLFSEDAMSLPHGPRLIG